MAEVTAFVHLPTTTADEADGRSYALFNGTWYRYNRRRREIGRMILSPELAETLTHIFNLTNNNGEPF